MLKKFRQINSLLVTYSKRWFDGKNISTRSRFSCLIFANIFLPNWQWKLLTGWLVDWSTVALLVRCFLLKPFSNITAVKSLRHISRLESFLFLLLSCRWMGALKALERDLALYLHTLLWKSLDDFFQRRFRWQFLKVE